MVEKPRRISIPSPPTIDRNTEEFILFGWQTRWWRLRKPLRAATYCPNRIELGVIVMEQNAPAVEDLSIEELNDVAAADCAGTASTASTPVSTAACVGCASV
ncbi:thiocillin family RiPP [Amycolatopsis benzoatilytica]|uniref:thiocillin family RiPP n=1 Tax=Amycolatopsis benzoatilytica TaxID=346045 RepID=UPI001B7F7E16|nr:thiocillin family RiPP [Amycolatopsis benzoatilytica]